MPENEIVLNDTDAGGDLVPYRFRAYMYRVLTAASPLVTAYGVMEESKWALWVGLGTAVLGLGTAAVHTSTAKGATP